MASYGVTCKIEGFFSFDISAESLEDALKIGKEKAAKMNPLRKELSWIDGHPEVDGVYEND